MELSERNEVAEVASRDLRQCEDMVAPGGEVVGAGEFLGVKQPRHQERTRAASRTWPPRSVPK